MLSLVLRVGRTIRTAALLSVSEGLYQAGMVELSLEVAARARKRKPPPMYV